MTKTICGVRYSAKSPLAFELIVNEDKMGLTLSWTDTIFSETVVIGPDKKEKTGTEHFLNEIFSEIREVIMDKAPNRQED